MKKINTLIVLTKNKSLTTPRSPISDNIHKTATALFSVNAIDKETMQKFNDSCLIKR